MKIFTSVLLLFVSVFTFGQSPLADKIRQLENAGEQPTYFAPCIATGTNIAAHDAYAEERLYFTVDPAHRSWN